VKNSYDSASWLNLSREVPGTVLVLEVYLGWYPGSGHWMSHRWRRQDSPLLAPYPPATQWYFNQQHVHFTAFVYADHPALVKFGYFKLGESSPSGLIKIQIRIQSGFTVLITKNLRKFRAEKKFDAFFTKNCNLPIPRPP
jgi:hypothetical protein